MVITESLPLPLESALGFHQHIVTCHISPHRAPVIVNIGHILLRLQTEWYHNLVPTNNDYHSYFLLIYMYMFHMVT